MIEYTRQAPLENEEEQFECDLCQFVYPVSVDRVAIEMYVKKVFGREYEERVICVICTDKINEATKVKA